MFKTNKRVPQLTGGAQPASRLCAICPNRAQQKDAVGYCWCEDHAHRAWLINWMAAHDWVELRCHPRAMGGDRECVVLQVIQGTDDYIWHIVDYIDYIEEEWKKSELA